MQTESSSTETNTWRSRSGSPFLYLWMQMLVKAIILCFPVAISMWFYFLPALVLGDNISPLLEVVLYRKLAGVLLGVFLYGFAALYNISLFGTYITCRPLLGLMLPGITFAVFLDTLFDLPLLAAMLAALLFIFTLYLIHHEKCPQNAPAHIRDQYVKKSLMIKPLTLMVCVIGAIFLILRITYSVFLESSLGGRVFIRFVVLPVMSSLSSALQMHFLRSLPAELTLEGLPSLWISNGMLKIFERLFTNSMLREWSYVSFFMTNLFASIVEMITHATYFARTRITQQMSLFLKRLRPRTLQPLGIAAELSSTDDRSQGAAFSRTDQEWLRDLRGFMIVEEISIEMMMILTVTMLLYFVHPLFKKDAFESIYELEDFIIRIFIQLGFEFLSDMFGLYWADKRERVIIQVQPVDFKDKWFGVCIFLIMYQWISLFYLFRIDS